MNAISICKNKPYLIHFSTDHLYHKKGYSKENEVILKNYYAYSKLQSEKYAQKVKSSIIRSNFFGNSILSNKKSLSDWIIVNLKKSKKINVFENIFFNPITFETLSKIIELIILKKKKGLYNIGSKNGFSKSKFARLIAKHKQMDLNLITNINSSKIFKTKRPKDMRMNVNKFEKLYNFKMPYLEDEIKKL